MNINPIIMAAIIIFPYSNKGKLTFANFNVFHIKMDIINKDASVVAIAAPLIPIGGTKIRLNTRI